MATKLMPGLLERLASHGDLRDLDIHFARFVGECANEPSDALHLAAALVSRATGDGHVCIDLAELAGKPLEASDAADAGIAAIAVPELSTWRTALRASGVVGDATENEPDACPLVLDAADRLYLARYWRYERDLASGLLARARGFCDGVDMGRFAAGLDRLFPVSDDVPDRQRVAAVLAVLKRLLVISGGPGTGKTTTVTRLLALLVEQSPAVPPRIALAAPTGKAAARLTESIRAAKATLACSAEVVAAIPDDAATLHRLLGWRPGGYRYHADNLLPADVLVVDEASMVDLPMMARLIAALPAHARLILLGDKDQLASVEAGNVLGDLCGGGDEPAYSAELCARSRPFVHLSPGAAASAIADSVILLTKSYRFGADSGIGRLARRVNEGDGRAALSVLCEGAAADLAWHPLTEPALPAALTQVVVDRYREFLEAADVTAALAAFNRFRVLCALKAGPLGVAALNKHIEQVLARAGLIRPQRRWYAGRPVMVTANDYGLRLYNGDIGLAWPEPGGERLAVFFATSDGGVRKVYPGRLGAVETCYAMTVHKSQGSEFDEVLMVLPGAESPIVTRELIYTGLTRARRKVTLYGEPSLFDAVARRVVRRSGLREALWGDRDPELPAEGSEPID